MNQPPEVHLLLDDLAARGLEVVRHGDFVGLRGNNLSRVPVSVWQALTRCSRQLAALLPDSATPFQSRGGGHRQPEGSDNKVS
jgi:hypothetical protein